MAKYVIKQFRGGLSDYEDKGIPGSFKYAKNIDIRKRVDSLSCGQALQEEGLVAGSQSPSASPSPSSSVSFSPSLSPSASPSPTPSPSSSVSPSASVSLSPSTTGSSSISLSPSVSQALTSVFRDLIHTFVKGSDGYLYGFGDEGYIYRRDADGYWERLYKDVDGAILGAAEWYSSDGDTYLVWATLNTLNKKLMPGLANWNDVEVVALDLSNATWHTMRESGGALMICNAGTLAMVGFDQSYTNNAVQLYPGNVANTLVERNGRTIVGTALKGNSDGGVNGAIDTEVQLAQIGTDGALFYANGQNTVAIKSFPGGGRVNPGGVANEVEQVNFIEWEQTALSWINKQSVGNMALFGVYDADEEMGGIYTYGRKNKNHPFVLNLEYQYDADEIGAVINYQGTTMFSYKDAGECGVLSVDPDNKAVGVWEGLDLYVPDNHKGNSEIVPWTIVKLMCKPLPEGTSVQFHYKIDKDGEFIQAKTVDDDTNFDTQGAKEIYFRIGAEGKIFEPKVVLYPYGNDCPEIYKMIIFFE